jgi:3-phosphoshikimate 1-carboxyvinyltransferase
MIAPSLEKGLTIHIEDKILSKDYIDMTLQIMQNHGITFRWNKNIIEVEKGNYTPKEEIVEPDWSAASYWFETVSLIENTELYLTGLLQNSLQGDSVLTKIFNTLGVQTKYDEKGLYLKNIQTTCRYFKYDFTNCPDLAQTLTVTLVAKGIPFKLSGLDNLSIKETDRIKALVVEFEKMGIYLQTNGKDYLSWEGNEDIKIPTTHCIKTYDDHRMAMAFAPLAIKTKSLTLYDPEVVKKSYPDFWDDLHKFGFGIYY